VFVCVCVCERERESRELKVCICARAHNECQNRPANAKRDLLVESEHVRAGKNRGVIEAFVWFLFVHLCLFSFVLRTSVFFLRV
jgi:hypothetical protein